MNHYKAFADAYFELDPLELLRVKQLALIVSLNRITKEAITFVKNKFIQKFYTNTYLSVKQGWLH
jgi:hypothetical protein